MGFRQYALVEVSEADCPFDTLWIIKGHDYLDLDWNMECPPRRAAIMPYLVRWHDVEVFALPLEMQYNYHVCVPDWSENLEPLLAL